MKALSLSQPWAWAVVHGPKRVENRTWKAPTAMLGQRFAIHAALSWDQEAYGGLRDGVFGSPPLGLPFPGDYQKGALIGVATLDRCISDLDLFEGTDSLPDDQRRWFFGPYGFVLSHVRALRQPIPCKGSLGFWSVPSVMIESCRNAS